jgi:hypothetical protein
MSTPPVLRMVPREKPERWLRSEVIERLSETDVKRVYQALGVKRFRTGGSADWKVFVPWRDNANTEAMTIRRADGVWQDHAQAEGGSIFDAVMKSGLAHDLNGAIEYVAEVCGFVKATPPGARSRPHRIINYDYFDELGTPLYRAERIETIDDAGVVSKRFVQKHWRGDELVAGMPAGLRRVPYNLPAIADPLNREQTVWVVEGEKCADLLGGTFGVLATTFVGAHWLDSYAGDLHGRNIVILADLDEPGWKKANEWALGLSARAASLKVVELVDLGRRTPTNGLDIADWIEQGKGYERLVDVVADTPIWKAPETKGLIEWADSFLVRPFTAPVYLVNNFWTPNSFGVIAAAQKSYKSFFVVDLLCSIASGTPFLGRAEWSVPEPQRVVYWMEEGSGWDFQRRVLRWCDARRVPKEKVFPTLGLIAGKRLRINDPAGMELLAQAVARSEPALIVCDTLAAASVGLDENKTPEMNIIVDNFKRFKDEYGVAVAYVHHTNRSGREGFASWRGSGVLGAAADCWVTLERKSTLTSEVQVEPGMKDHPPLGRFKVELRDAPIMAADGTEVLAGALFYVGFQSKAEAQAEDNELRYEDVAAYIDDSSRTGWLPQDESSRHFDFHRKGKNWTEFRIAGEQAGWWRYVRQPGDDGVRRAGRGQPPMGLQITRSRADD